jgi:hypothetical protein
VNVTVLIRSSGTRCRTSVPPPVYQTFTPKPFHVPVAVHFPSGLRAAKTALV